VGDDATRVKVSTCTVLAGHSDEAVATATAAKHRAAIERLIIKLKH
jgi:hypothetical protein